ncbi:P-loop containing nucleoside triphosphate hydrolase protein [Penicillium macrosclerotiorum]|uniref:P-loop containing nucleoside triphosphate hydrolase protein n=1 Tax=Penicillium macrosclerotiorum TaxID=303699 RepID=UPI0025491A11|nr:P-loop containing nucleoside triphosphate hydrolase protein [Penicillium macrosclerotiorum]KAJ5691985.1 P-loop containing nucleoside triphosphate hydrolase protein [Penicillium macrosclerotiorum]
MSHDPKRWVGLGMAADDNIPCLPTYTGHTWSQDDWNAYFGPCEALTDVTSFAEPLLREFPEVRVILVHRDFDPWVRSFQQTIVLPSSAGFLAWLSGHVMEPFIGLHISQTTWKMSMGLLGRHYANVRRMVPAKRLLETDLKDLDWKPLCEFLEKDTPVAPFPHLNDSRVVSNSYAGSIGSLYVAGMLKASVPTLRRGGGGGGGGGGNMCHNGRNVGMGPIWEVNRGLQADSTRFRSILIFRSNLRCKNVD